MTANLSWAFFQLMNDHIYSESSGDSGTILLVLSHMVLRMKYFNKSSTIIITICFPFQHGKYLSPKPVL